MKKLSIALLAGGNSSEREVSLGSAGQVAGALDPAKYDVYFIDLRGRDWICTSLGERPRVDLNDFSLTVRGRKIMFDYALIMIHGTPGEDGKLQGYLEMMDIPYSSCDLVSTVLTFDKHLCKKIVAEAGLNVTEEIYLTNPSQVDPETIAERLGFPMFIKPNASGSSFGVTKVRTREEIVPALELAFTESDAVLAEKFVEGREFGCGVMIAGDEEFVLPITEIIPKNDFFDYEAKYTPGFSEEITPADLDGTIADRIKKYARTAYKVCGCRGIVRIDFIVTGDGTPYFIEVNSVPGMSSGSIVPQQIRCAGYDMGGFLDRLICSTMTRKTSCE